MTLTMLRNSEPFIGSREILLVVIGMTLLIVIVAVASHAGYVMGLADGYRTLEDNPYATRTNRRTESIRRNDAESL